MSSLRPLFTAKPPLNLRQDTLTIEPPQTPPIGSDNKRILRTPPPNRPGQHKAGKRFLITDSDEEPIPSSRVVRHIELDEDEEEQVTECSYWNEDESLVSPHACHSPHDRFYADHVYNSASNEGDEDWSYVSDHEPQPNAFYGGAYDETGLYPDDNSHESYEQSDLYPDDNSHEPYEQSDLPREETIYESKEPLSCRDVRTYAPSDSLNVYNTTNVTGARNLTGLSHPTRKRKSMAIATRRSQRNRCKPQPTYYESESEHEHTRKKRRVQRKNKDDEEFELSVEDQATDTESESESLTSSCSSASSTPSRPIRPRRSSVATPSRSTSGTDSVPWTPSRSGTSDALESQSAEEEYSSGEESDDSDDGSSDPIETNDSCHLESSDESPGVDWLELEMFKRFFRSTNPFSTLMWEKWKMRYFEPVLRRGNISQEETLHQFLKTFEKGRMWNMSFVTKHKEKEKCWACQTKHIPSYRLNLVVRNQTESYYLGRQCGERIQAAGRVMNLIYALMDKYKLLQSDEDWVAEYSRIDQQMDQDMLRFFSK